MPLAYELASALAFRGHICNVFSLRNRNRVELMLAESWMADKRVGVGNPRPSLSGATALYYWLQ
jgi:hypothetical protein